MAAQRLLVSSREEKAYGEGGRDDDAHIMQVGGTDGSLLLSSS